MSRTLPMPVHAFAAWSLMALSAGTPVAAAGDEHVDHAGHGSSVHAGHDAGRDELGRSLYGMKHEMDAAMFKELRAKVPLYERYSDAEIALSMDMMGAEYAWYISPPELRGEQGLLILMHGFREQGDKQFRDRMQPMGDIFPTALGVGMAMMMSTHIQVALDDLQAAGVKQVVVVPVVSTDSNELYRQWLYIFGREKEAEFASVPRVRTGLDVAFVPPPGDDPLVAEILLDHALEISTKPQDEVVIIAGHGPTGVEDNAREMRVLASLARIVREDGGFADVQGITLQDDAPREVRAANVKKLRAMVEQATREGRQVLVVTNLIGARTIQAKLRDDLKGLEFRFSNKGIAQHDNFMKWMSEAVRSAFEARAAASPAPAG